MPAVVPSVVAVIKISAIQRDAKIPVRALQTGKYPINSFNNYHQKKHPGSSACAPGFLYRRSRPPTEMPASHKDISTYRTPPYPRASRPSSSNNRRKWTQLSFPPSSCASSPVGKPLYPVCWIFDAR